MGTADEVYEDDLEAEEAEEGAARGAPAAVAAPASPAPLTLAVATVGPARSAGAVPVPTPKGFASRAGGAVSGSLEASPLGAHALPVATGRHPVVLALTVTTVPRDEVAVGVAVGSRSSPLPAGGTSGAGGASGSTGGAAGAGATKAPAGKARKRNKKNHRGGHDVARAGGEGAMEPDTGAGGGVGDGWTMPSSPAGPWAAGVPGAGEGSAARHGSPRFGKGGHARRSDAPAGSGDGAASGADDASGGEGVARAEPTALPAIGKGKGGAAAGANDAGGGAGGKGRAPGHFPKL